MIEFITINSPAEIDVDKHAVIEASAGTGKTYTITALVMHLLLIKEISIEKILIVTFTEKATAELRERIHCEVESLQNKEDDEHKKELLNNALKNFANARIFTIHGFCQRVLRENAFENRGSFELELADDKPLLIDQLKHMKRRWPAIDGIEDILRDINYSPVWDQQIISMAMKVDPQTDLILPEPADVITAKFDLLFSQLNTATQESCSQQIISLKGSTEKTLSKRLTDFLKPAFQQIDECHDKKSDFTQNCALWGKSFSAKIFSRLKVNNEENRLACPELFTFIDSLDELCSRALQLDAAQKQKFTQSSLQELIDRLQLHKKQNNLLSFADMISHLYRALKTEENEEFKILTDKLRADYDYALIDEFQDTDLQQWFIFHKLFVENSLQTGNRLMLIGDPKQAIYGFRGADVHAYEKAKMEIFDLGSEMNGFYRLGTNYRSMPDLISNFNSFFTTWFDDDATVTSPSQEHRNNQGPLLGRDDSDFPAFNLMTIDGEGLKSHTFKNRLAGKIADTIKELHGSIDYYRKSKIQTLDYSDICVLVHSRAEAAIIEKALKSRQIPHTFYKKTGLYESEEAIHFEILFKALAHPEQRKLSSKAMLTLFFNLTANDIPLFENEGFPELNRRWQKLHELAAEQAWPQLFKTLLEDHGTIFNSAADQNWRQIANLKQISHEIMSIALEKNLDSLGISRLLYDWRENGSSTEDLHEKDTEKPAVRIMTIHASKGLEFPIVFLFGGYASSNRSDLYHKFYDKESQRTAYDLSKSSATQVKEQDLRENERLYYVALTRAVYKIFLPSFNKETLSRANGRYSTQVSPLLEIHNDSSQAIRNETLPQSSIHTYQVDNSEPPSFTKLRVDTKKRTRRIHSFSSLMNVYTAGSVNFGPGFSNTVRSEHSDEEPQLLTKSSELRLRGGINTGHTLHGIFENIVFKDVIAHTTFESFIEDDKLMQTVDWQMNKFRMPNRQVLDEDQNIIFETRREFAKLCYHTLNKPLDALGGFKLGNIPLRDRRHELEFHLCQKDMWNRQSRLTGFIDLFFRIKDSNGIENYFILDWKSNLNELGFTPEALRDSCMKEHKYDLQYRLYALAMQKWFDSMKLKKSKLAGALYIFSRGMDCHEKEQNGIFFDNFSTFDVLSTADELGDLSNKK